MSVKRALWELKQVVKAWLYGEGQLIGLLMSWFMVVSGQVKIG